MDLSLAEEVVAVDDGTDPVIGSFVPERDYFNELFEDHELNPEVPKSLPICDISGIVHLRRGVRCLEQ
ncbi:hypothetical protein HanRHA438_Chr13g0590531 [Helianthus annuus]|nr:hypothetical protein HanRHA438_Chr13g0590531 [Helianthus annuus]